MITRTLRGAGALIAVAVLMIGWPIALWTLGRAVSEWLPDLSDPAGLLARPDAGGLFLLIVLALGWVAWAVWTTALLLEVLAQARGVPTPRLGGLFPQRSAAALVTAIAVAFAVSPAVALAEPPAPPAVPAGTTAAAPALENDSPASDPARQSAPHHHTVVPGDTLWDIAEDELADPYRWTEIADANRGIAQPDGQHLNNPDLILPGWTLSLPDGPASLSEEPPAPEASGHTAGVPGSGDPAVIPPTTPLTAAGPAPAPAPAAPLPETPLTAGEDPQQGHPSAAATAWDLTDEGRSNPRHGVLGLPDWITHPLIPTTPEDAPDLAVALRTI